METYNTGFIKNKEIFVFNELFFNYDMYLSSIRKIYFYILKYKIIFLMR